MIDILRNRRSIRKYTCQAIEQDKIDLLAETALRAPTSKNKKPCQFIFVTDKEVLLKLSQSKPHGAAFLKNAPLGIVVCADTEQSDVWVEDASIASILLQLTAQSLGLGSCWVQIRRRIYNEETRAEDYIKNLLDLPENIGVESIVAVGYTSESRAPVPFDELDFSKISYR